MYFSVCEVLQHTFRRKRWWLFEVLSESIEQHLHIRVIGSFEADSFEYRYLLQLVFSCVAVSKLDVLLAIF